MLAVVAGLLGVGFGFVDDIGDGAELDEHFDTGFEHFFADET